MTSAVGRFVLDRPGGPEARRWAEEPRQPTGSQEICVRHEAFGVDYIDTMIRSGSLPVPLPTGIGYAAVGIADEVGGDVRHVKRGERVAYMYF